MALFGPFLAAFSYRYSLPGKKSPNDIASVYSTAVWTLPTLDKLPLPQEENIRAEEDLGQPRVVTTGLKVWRQAKNLRQDQQDDLSDTAQRQPEPTFSLARACPIHGCCWGFCFHTCLALSSVIITTVYHN